jgi:hypothetical protein
MRVRFITPGEQPEWRTIEMAEVPRIDEIVSLGREGSYRYYVLCVRWPLEDSWMAESPADLQYDVEVELRPGVPAYLRRRTP